MEATMEVSARRFEPENGNGERSMIEVAQTRAAQEVQAAMVVAKKYPRDEQESWDRIMRACKRKTLAEQALYAYPKGGQVVTGPSIRMAEAMAQAWGNIDFGIVELEQKNGESVVMSYAWDLETNTRQTKIFTVKHERHTKKGSYSLNDPREIYEMTANQGARRLRACILGVIPGDVVDAAIDECEKTLKGKNTEPLADRVRKMISAFGEYGVTQEMIERRVGHKADAIIEAELLSLRKIFASIKDNMASREEFFEVKPGLQERLDKKSDPDAHDSPADEPAVQQEKWVASGPSHVTATLPDEPPDWQRRKIALAELADSLGIPAEQFENGFKKYLIAKRKVGKVEQLTPAEWDDVTKAVQQKQGHFAI